MAKTGNQVIGDIRQMLIDSTLATMISGEIYRRGTRPRDSQKEDAVVGFSAGLPDEIQTGVAIVNIYVPDIDTDGNGTWIEDGERAEEIERLAQAWADSLTAEVSCYKFRLAQTIYTEEDPDIHQHFVTVRLHFEYFGSDDEPLRVPQEAMIDGYDTDTEKGYEPIMETEDGETLIIQPIVTKQNQ
ncbi:MAG: hypothetical protein HUK04_00405 [Bacteroidaceae bacterium]|nr:hypothetical protein [Bacteroidaceae bacterium]